MSQFCFVSNIKTYCQQRKELWWEKVGWTLKFTALILLRLGGTSEDPGGFFVGATSQILQILWWRFHRTPRYRSTTRSPKPGRWWFYRHVVSPIDGKRGTLTWWAWQALTKLRGPRVPFRSEGMLCLTHVKYGSWECTTLAPIAKYRFSVAFHCLGVLL